MQTQQNPIGGIPNKSKIRNKGCLISCQCINVHVRYTSATDTGKFQVILQQAGSEPLLLNTQMPINGINVLFRHTALSNLVFHLWWRSRKQSCSSNRVSQPKSLQKSLYAVQNVNKNQAAIFWTWFRHNSVVEIAVWAWENFKRAQCVTISTNANAKNPPCKEKNRCKRDPGTLLLHLGSSSFKMDWG